MPISSITVSTTLRRTALECIQAAMGELGMSRPSTLEDTNDETAIQLLYLFNALGENLSRFPFFEELNQTFTITTTTATAYPLPEDWGTPINGTNWDRSGRWPLLGPKTASEWQTLQAGFPVSGPRFRFRYYNGQFNLYPAPSAGLTLTQEYISRYWVLGIGSTAGIADAGKVRVSLNTDYCVLDERMMIEGLKLAFLEVKGLDSSLQSRRWDSMMEAAWASSKGASILSLSNCSEDGLLSENNIPDGDYGS